MIKLLGIAPRELVRRQEPSYKTARLDNATDDEVVHAMVRDPILIERPIVVNGDRAAIGRPPESVLKILSHNYKWTGLTGFTGFESK